MVASIDTEATLFITTVTSSQRMFHDYGSTTTVWANRRVDEYEYLAMLQSVIAPSFYDYQSHHQGKQKD